jgi:hypothetical protein
LDCGRARSPAHERISRSAQIEQPPLGAPDGSFVPLLREIVTRCGVLRRLSQDRE